MHVLLASELNDEKGGEPPDPIEGHMPLEIPGQNKAARLPVPPEEGDSGEGELMIWALALSCLCRSGLMALCPRWTAPTSATAWMPPPPWEDFAQHLQGSGSFPGGLESRLNQARRAVVER